MNFQREKLGFVLPRYREGLAGGAETLAAQLAKRAVGLGYEVEILTTCALDNRTWSNELEPGVFNEGELRVRRFLVSPRDLEQWIPKQIALSEGLNLGLEGELEWMEHSVNSYDLYDFIEREGGEYKALFFAPYLFGTTFWGALIKPERSILIPCLHDESYAYTSIMSALFSEVRGAFFNCDAERDLAYALYGNIKSGAVVGLGFDDVSDQTLSDAKSSAYFKEDFPYLLYLGRKETGKNVQVLIDYFVTGKEVGSIGPDVKLVIAGGGSFSDLMRDSALERDDIIDLAHLSEEDKRKLIAHSLALCQPSMNESFSIVIMEAWLLDVPVLVHGNCPVTRDHVVKARGGLYFSNAEEFAEVVAELMSNTDLARDLAKGGKNYVRKEYSWDAVMKRFENGLAGCFATIRS